MLKNWYPESFFYTDHSDGIKFPILSFPQCLHTLSMNM